MTQSKANLIAVSSAANIDILSVNLTLRSIFNFGTQNRTFKDIPAIKIALKQPPLYRTDGSLSHVTLLAASHFHINELHVI